MATPETPELVIARNYRDVAHRRETAHLEQKAECIIVAVVGLIVLSIVICILEWGGVAVGPTVKMVVISLPTLWAVILICTK